MPKFWNNGILYFWFLKNCIDRERSETQMKRKLGWVVSHLFVYLLKRYKNIKIESVAYSTLITEWSWTPRSRSNGDGNPHHFNYHGAHYK